MQRSRIRTLTTALVAAMVVTETIARLQGGLGARGGVYLAGDLIDMIGDLFDVDAFVKRYSDKGRLSDYVGEIPGFKATARDMEVIGLATLFD